MNARILWQQIMHYGEFDRLPVIHWDGWDETLERWYDEGMPRDQNVHEYLDAVPNWAWLGADLKLFPRFEEEVVEETDEYRIFRNEEGVVCQDWKHKSCIPHYMEFTLKTADDWPEYKKRLQPDPARLREDLDSAIRQAEKSELPIVIGTASMMGWIRNWMGVENMSYLIHDDRDCYADMVNTLADLTCWSIDQIVPHMSTIPDFAFGWEDICGKSGPLVSPAIFDESVAPGYRRIRDKLESYGVKLLAVDSDGFVEPLIQHWLDAGVNVQFPLERGTWKAYPEEIRRKFGKELRIIGGFDKFVLERGRAAIDKEIADRLDLVREGGYLMEPDHVITPGVSLADYQYYLDRVRKLRF